MFLRVYSLKPRFDETNTKRSSLVAGIKSINNISHNWMILMCKANKKFIVLFNLTVTIRCRWALFYYLCFVAGKIQIQSLSNISKVTQKWEIKKDLLKSKISKLSQYILQTSTMVAGQEQDKNITLVRVLSNINIIQIILIIKIF